MGRLLGRKVVHTHQSVVDSAITCATAITTSGIAVSGSNMASSNISSYDPVSDKVEELEGRNRLNEIRIQGLVELLGDVLSECVGKPGERGDVVELMARLEALKDCEHQLVVADRLREE